MSVGDYIKQEWGVIVNAPATFLVGAALVAGVTWAASTLFYKEEIEIAHQQREFWKDKAQTRANQPAQYIKAPTADPDQVEKTTNLETKPNEYEAKIRDLKREKPQHLRQSQQKSQENKNIGDCSGNSVTGYRNGQINTC